MGNLFLKLLNMSLSASWLVVALILLRPLLKKAPKWISCLLWAFVAFRLICPFSFESSFSLVPASEIIPIESIFPDSSDFAEPTRDSASKNSEAQNGIASVDKIFSSSSEGTGTSQMLPSKTKIFAGIWSVGMVVMLFHAFISLMRLKGKVSASLLLYDNTFLCDEIPTPFLLGILKPRIYLPSQMAGEHLISVISHEQAHLERRDHLWKPLGYLILAIYWFNPLMWAAYFLFCRDIELACDERVVRHMKKEEIAAYSQAMLDFNYPRRMVHSYPLAFGEIGVTERIKAVLNYKKPAFWSIAASIAACVVIAVCFLTNPKTTPFGAKTDLPISPISGMDSLDPISVGTKDSVPQDPVSSAILEENADSYPDDYDFACCDFVTLETETSSSAPDSDGSPQTVTYYGWALYQQYRISEDGIEDVGGSHTPVALTFEQNNNDYILKEYWSPRDGSYFTSDIRDKFPAHIAEDGIDSQKFIRGQIQSCYKQAVQFSGLDTDIVIKNLLDIICSSPSVSSSPQDYIDEHYIDYRELLYYGEYTLRYCFRRFEHGGETGLDGKIMAAACEEILQTKGTIPLDAGTAETGQLWYDTLHAHASNRVEPYL